MEKKPGTYCKAAIFRCISCSYSAEIYSSTEWIEKEDSQVCGSCRRAGNHHFDIPVIYRSDLDDDIPLHLQVADVPEAYLSCTECSGKDSLHWTDILVACPYCNCSGSTEPNTMVFDGYTTGRDILNFYERICEWEKPSHPLLEFIDDQGHLHLGPFSEFSAS
jgi:hypothetical protein